MSRYIDAYKAKNELRKRKAECDKRDDKFTLGIVEAALDYVETADVAPVVHAHWIKSNHLVSDMLLDTNEYYSCSLCGQKLRSQHNYCPHCGAKMDEVAEDEDI